MLEEGGGWQIITGNNIVSNDRIAVWPGEEGGRAAQREKVGEGGGW